ncbi:MAG: response regulator [Chitinophagaceae bacterium]|nr:MAG: response regulator [Chitinophagaceae bacterium]
MKKILLIEDNQEILENTAEILELAGYEVYTASEGRAGVAAAIDCHPDLIISDIMMPVLDGYGVLHLVQKNPGLTGTPLIFLTAKTDRSDFRKGMEMGADDYITKPFTDTELLNAVETRLKKAERAKVQNGDIADSEKQEHTLKELFENSVVDKYKRKQIIFTEGNHPQYLFYVVKGKVKAFKTSEYGKELTVGLYAAGDFIGYTALLEESTYRVTAEALEETEIAIISRKDFFDLIDSNSAVAMQFIRILADKNNQKAEQMVQLAYDSLRKRVANALLLLQHKFKSGSEGKFTIKITREELANLSGTSTESLIRTLSDFRSEKLIAIHGGDIEILDKRKLENMVN